MKSAMKSAMIVTVAALLFTTAFANECNVKCTCQNTTVFCTNLDGIVPANPFPNSTTRLILSNHNLGGLDADTFAGLSNLEYLDVTQNILGDVETGLFNGLSSLKVIFMSSAKISSMAQTLLHPIGAALEELHLNNNLLTGLELGLFQYATNLRVLDVSQNDLSSLKFGIFDNLGNLERLLLDDNHLHTKDFGTLSNLVNLKQLMLRGNDIEGIQTPMLDNLYSLEHLSLAGNPLQDESIDAGAFAKLQNVTTLNMDTVDAVVNLDSIPEGLVNGLSKLHTLYLAGNGWNCCGLEWLSNFAHVKDSPRIVCARPFKFNGQVLKTVVDGLQASESIGCQDEPDAVQITDVSDPTLTGATLTWFPVGDNAFQVTSYMIEFAESGTGMPWQYVRCPYGTTDVAQQQLNPSAPARCNIVPGSTDETEIISFSINDDRLKPYTMYNVRIQAQSQDPSGTSFTSEPSDPAAFNTAEAAPSAVGITNVVPTSTTVTLSLKPPTEPNGVLLYYDVSLTDTMYGTTTNFVGLTELVKIMELRPYSRYILDVKANTSSGYGPISTQEFTTAQSVPNQPSKPVVYPVGIGSTWLEVTWSALISVDQNGEITKTCLYSGHQGDQQIASNCIDATSADSEFRFRLEGLVPAERYALSVSFFTQEGESIKSVPGTAFTLNAAPIAPAAPGGVSLDRATIQVSWEAPGITNGDIVKYQIEMVDTSGVAGTRLSFHDAQVFDAIKRDLSSFTEYRFRVQAFTNVNGTDVAGPYSEPSIILTNESISERAVAVVDGASANQINLTWAHPSKPYGVVTSFVVYQTNKSQIIPNFPTSVDENRSIIHTETVTTATENYTFTHGGLDAYTNYTYSIAVVNSAGASVANIYTVGETEASVPKSQPAPASRVIGYTQIELSWTTPLEPNGVITKFDLKQGDTVVYSGLPTNRSDGRYAVNITDLEDGQLYEFSVVSYNVAGVGAVSSIATAETSSSSPNVTTQVVISLLCVAIVVLTLGLVRERRHDEISLAKRMTDSLMFPKDMEAYPRIENEEPDIDEEDAESSDGSEYGDEEVMRPSLVAVESLAGQLNTSIRTPTKPTNVFPVLAEEDDNQPLADIDNDSDDEDDDRYTPNESTNV